MAATGATPISLYYSTTASTAPTAGNLVAGELAINTNDGILYYKDSSGVVQSIASKAGNSGSFTNLAYTGTFTGGTGIVNLGSGQFYKDASGNVGIGTASPAYKLEVSGSAVRIANGSNGSAFNNGLIFDNTASASPNNYLPAINWNTGTLTWATIDGFRAAGGGYGGDLRFSTMNTGSTNTERMRIDSSGNLLVGTTATSGANTSGLALLNPTTATVIYLGHPTGTATGSAYMGFLYNGTLIGSITQSGTTAVLYNLTSDARLKTNIVDAPLGNIDNIKVRSFDWKSDGSHVKYGFIAQELVEVAPYAVHQPQNPEEMMAVDYSKLVPMMIKEIQDLKQRIKTLEAK